MRVENRVVTNVGTLDFSRCDVTVDCDVMMFVRVIDIPESMNQEIHKAIAKVKEDYSIIYHQEWEAEKINEVSLQITLNDSNKPKYWFSVCFEDTKDPTLCECACIDVDMTAHEAEMKDLMANELIKALM